MGQEARRIFHLHLVSDSTGETLQSISKAALVQFEGVDVRTHTWPLVRSPSQMERIFQDIREQPGLVMFTLVNDDIRKALVEACVKWRLPHLSVLDPVIGTLARYLGTQAHGVPGRQHAMDAQYHHRIDALHFTVAHDDGQHPETLANAEIIIVGVSRTSKTPTSIYLANKGYRTANIPFVPTCPLPAELDGLTDHFIVGLTVNPERLVHIRTNRLRALNEGHHTEYVDMESVKNEIALCRRLCHERGWPVIDVTRRSIEETAVAIINRYYSWQEERAANVAGG